MTAPNTPPAPGSAEASEPRRCCCLHHAEDCGQTKFAYRVALGSAKCGCGWLTEGAKYFCGQKPAPSAPDAGREALCAEADRWPYRHPRPAGETALLLENMALMLRADAATLAALRQENETLRGAIDCACNALTDSIRVSGNDARTNMHWVEKLRSYLPKKEAPHA